MPSSIRDANWTHMTRDEEIFWSGIPSLWTIAIPAVIGFVLIVVGVSLTIAFSVGLPWVPEMLTGTLAFAPLLIAVFGLVVIGLPALLLRYTRYVITSEELYRKEGFFRTDVVNIRHDRIQNTSCNQSFLERIFSFGDILIFTSGTDDSEIMLTNVPQPQEVRGILAKAQDVAAERSEAAESPAAAPQADGASGSDVS